MRFGESAETAMGLSTGIGSLPFRDANVAAEFALTATPLLPAIPSLPKRSPAEGMISQAVLGIEGISLGQYGSIAIDTDAVDIHAPVETDFESDAFVGFRVFLDKVEKLETNSIQQIKWQFVGPISLGVSLCRAGLAPEVAFEIAVRAVRSHTQSLIARVARALPSARQVVLLDEPSFGILAQEDSPVRSDVGIDMLSAALALVERDAIAGVHCCGHADWSMLIDAGPSIISLPVDTDFGAALPRLLAFMDRDGVIAWGAVKTGGPLPISSERAWKNLSTKWRQLVEDGADPYRLVSQCIVTPECGFGLHSEGATWRAMEHVREIALRVANESTSFQLTFGA